MLAIQNQIPILSKLLSTVIQQQQHVQSHQQDALAASASGGLAVPARSRKTSSSQDLGGGQPVPGDAEVGAAPPRGGDVKREAAEEAEGRNCVIS